MGLADSYVYLGSQRWILPQDAYAHAHEALCKALELDESLAEAHSSLGWLNWRYDWNFPVAEREFRYALELNTFNSRSFDSAITGSILETGLRPWGTSVDPSTNIRRNRSGVIGTRLDPDLIRYFPSRL